MKICTKGHQFDAELIGDMEVCPIRNCGNAIIECDDGMIPIVTGLNQLGYQTIHSCSGHWGGKMYDMYVTIGIMPKDEVMNFVSHLLSYTWNRNFSDFEVTVFATDVDAEYLYEDTIFCSRVSSDCGIAERLSSELESSNRPYFIIKLGLDPNYADEDINTSERMISLYNKLISLHQFVEWLTEEKMLLEKVDMPSEDDDDDDFDDDIDPEIQEKLERALRRLDAYNNRKKAHLKKVKKDQKKS